jgi:hypothetical protein
MRVYTPGFGLALVALLSSGTALGAPEPKLQLSGDFPIDLTNPEGSVPNLATRNAHPLEFGYFIQDLIALAVDAGKGGDHRAEAHFYRAFSLAVPDRSVAFSKLCQALEEAGDRQNAEAACRDALGRPGIEWSDYARFVRLLLQKPGALSPTDVEDITQIVAHLQAMPETRLGGTQLQCEYAMHVDDLPLLEKCSRELSAALPDDAKGLTFAWAAALRKGDKDTALRLIARARTLGIQPEGIRRMERATSELHFGWRRWLMIGWPLVVATLLLIAGLAYVLLTRRRRAFEQRFT